MIISDYGEVMGSAGDKTTHFGDSAQKGSSNIRYVLLECESSSTVVAFCQESCH